MTCHGDTRYDVHLVASGAWNWSTLTFVHLLGMSPQEVLKIAEATLASIQSGTCASESSLLYSTNKAETVLK